MIDIRRTNPPKKARPETVEEQEARVEAEHIRDTEASNRRAQQAREREAQARAKEAEEADAQRRTARKRKAPIDIRATNAKKKSRMDEAQSEAEKSDSEPEAPRRSARVAAAARPIQGRASINDPAVLTELVTGTAGRSYRETLRFVADYRRAHPSRVPAGVNTHSLASSLLKYHKR